MLLFLSLIVLTYGYFYMLKEKSQISKSSEENFSRFAKGTATSLLLGIGFFALGYREINQSSNLAKKMRNLAESLELEDNSHPSLSTLNV